jgi:beta-glucosidase
MAGMGLQAYRFSISWPRVLPQGVGTINQKGLDFYSRLVDALLEHGITPWVTLFHWDYPYALYCRGGWLNRDSTDWFAEYTAVVVDRLSDRVGHWMTLNEPQCFIGMGHQDGTHAPGLQLGLTEVLLAAHHALLAHGRAVQVIRALAKTKPQVSAAQATLISIPAADRPEDIAAARTSMFSVRERRLFNNSWFSDPMILGRYPEEGLALFKGDMPELRADDLAVIQQPLDFYGANIYSGHYVRATASGDFEQETDRDLPQTAMGWPITPEALYWGPKFLHERYGLPIVITENGMASEDKVKGGRVHDRQRIEFLAAYLKEYARAISDGVPALGYFLWSVMDNFEWAEGYARRFGLIHVNYATQRRTPKDSAAWYKGIIAANGENLSRDSARQSGSKAGRSHPAI